MNENKYILSRHRIYETIYKMIETGLSPKEIAEQMHKDYRLEVTMHELSPRMVEKMYMILAEQAYYDKNKKHFIGE